MLVAVVCAATGVYPQRGLAQDAASPQGLAELRLKVDELAAAVRDERRQLSADKESYAHEGRELELALIRERARVDALERRAEALRQATASDASNRAADRDAIVAIIDRLDQRIVAGLPYRRDDRRRALAELRRALIAEQLPPASAASRIWRLMRDDARLAESHGLVREIIDVDGKPVLAEVLRLGLVAMLLRLPGGAHGCLTRQGEAAPRLLKVTVPEEAAAIEAAFVAVAAGAAPGQLMLPAHCLGGAR